MPSRVLCGVGLRSQHVWDFLGELPDGVDKPDFLEVHAENFIDLASPRSRALLSIREDYPISCHAVGLSLGSAEGIDDKHLAKIKALVEVLEPMLVSEHVAWSVAGGYYANDLLPLPLTREALDVICANIDKVQSTLKRAILVENPSSYISFASDEMGEAEFLAEIIRRSGCGLLLDLNNVFVSCENHGLSADNYLAILPDSAIGEVHLAGHVIDEGAGLRIDTHSRPVDNAVWDLYARFIEARKGKEGEGREGLPVLIEWDSHLPELSVLLGQQHKAREIAACV